MAYERTSWRNTVQGQLKLPTTGSSGGILLGGDVRLYREWANVLSLGAGDKIFLATNDKVEFRDGTLYISSKTDGHLDLDADVSIDMNTPIVVLPTTTKLQFRDAQLYIYSSGDGNLDLYADVLIDFHAPVSFDSYIDLEANNIRNVAYLELDETATPGATADHGKLYTKNDNKLYFQDGAGAEHTLAFV